MANEKFKCVLAKADGTTFTVTENHPKLTASNTDKEDAMNGLGDAFGATPVRIDLNSDTTVWKA